MLAELGLIGTIGEDDEVPVESESDSGDEEEEVRAGRGSGRGRGQGPDLRESLIASLPRDSSGHCPRILSIPWGGSHSDPGIFLSLLAISFSPPLLLAVPFRVALLNSVSAH